MQQVPLHMASWNIIPAMSPIPQILLRYCQRRTTGGKLVLCGGPCSITITTLEIPPTMILPQKLWHLKLARSLITWCRTTKRMKEMTTKLFGECPPCLLQKRVSRSPPTLGGLLGQSWPRISGTPKQPAGILRLVGVVLNGRFSHSIMDTRTRTRFLMELSFNFQRVLHDILEIKHTSIGQKRFMIGLPRLDWLIQISTLWTVLMSPKLAPIQTKLHGVTIMPFSYTEPLSCTTTPPIPLGKHEPRVY